MQAVNMNHAGWIIVVGLILVLIIPSLLLQGLQMSCRTKISILFLFGLGPWQVFLA